MKLSRSIVVSIAVVFYSFQFVFGQEQLKIMPLGNSITTGIMCFNGNYNNCEMITAAEAVGYRNKLYNLLDGAGYNFDFVGSIRGYGTAIMDDPDNAGFPGIYDQELADIIETGFSPRFSAAGTSGPYLNTFQPDIVLLHIGTNDVSAGNYNDVSAVNRLLDAVDTYESTYGKPVIVFIAKIISRGGYACNTHPGTTTYNNLLGNLIQSRISNGDLLIPVDMHCGANIDYNQDMIDQVHPTQGGYDKIADHWFDYIDNYNTKPEIGVLPDINVDRGSSFQTISLNNYVSDVEDTPQELNWSIIPSDPQYFNITIDENNIATIVPKDDQWSGSETIEFIVSDNGRIIENLSKSDIAIVEITVNWIPEIIGQNAISTQEDKTLALTISDLVLAEQEKAPADLEISVLNGSNYTASGFFVMPDEDFTGQLTVPVKVIDGEKESNIYNLTINVTEENDPPVINDQLTFPELIQGQCLEIKLSMLDVTDVDDSYPVNFNGLIEAGSNYSYSGMNVCSEPGYVGELDVNLRVSDGQDYSQKFVFKINVIPAKPEFILPDVLEVYEDEDFSQNISVEYYDQGSLEYSAVQLPEWLYFNPYIQAMGGTPTNDHVGPNQVTLRVSDGAMYTVDTTFVIEVLNINDPPVILSQPVVNVRSGELYDYAVEAEDVDADDILVFYTEDKPDWTGFNSESGELIGTPSREDAGVHQVKIKVSDGEYETEQNFSIEVEYYNYPPVVTSVPEETIMVDQVYSYGFKAEDQENDPMTYFAGSLPEWLSFYTSSRVLIGTPGIEDLGTAEVILGVTDQIDTTYLQFNLSVVTTTSLEDLKSAAEVSVYPNPASGILFVKCENFKLTGDVYFEIYDYTGRKLLDKNITDEVTPVNLQKQRISKGFYLYRLIDRSKLQIIDNGKLIIH